jgi:phage tail tape-measure protein
MKFGSLLGSLAGAIGSKLAPIPGVDGATLGGAIGGLMPFKTGGAVGPRNRACLLHKNEYVLPANAKPTKAQRAIVAKNKRNARKKK